MHCFRHARNIFLEPTKSLSATFGVVALIFLVGTVTGVLAGYFGGVIDAVIMRIADIFMSFPSIVLILVLVAVLGPSVWSVTCVIGVLGWTQFARLIYANVLSVSEKEYVESARAIASAVSCSALYHFAVMNLTSRVNFVQ